MAFNATADKDATMNKNQLTARVSNAVFEHNGLSEIVPNSFFEIDSNSFAINWKPCPTLLSQLIRKCPTHDTLVIQKLCPILLSQLIGDGVQRFTSLAIDWRPCLTLLSQSIGGCA